MKKNIYTNIIIQILIYLVKNFFYNKNEKKKNVILLY